MVKTKPVKKNKPKPTQKPKTIANVNPPEIIIGESGVNVVTNSFILNRDIDQEAYTNVYDRVNQILNYNYYTFKEAPESITCYLHSYGGDVYTMLAIINFLKQTPSKINMHCFGVAASAAAVIFTCASGERLISNSSTLMFHQIRSTLFETKTTDIVPTTANIVNQQKIVSKLLAEHTKKDTDFWDKIVNNDYYPSPLECVEYGIADDIVM